MMTWCMSAEELTFGDTYDVVLFEVSVYSALYHTVELSTLKNKDNEHAVRR